jgi:hypothetical protein
VTSAAFDPIAIALRVAAAIESAQGSYFVGGSVASSLQGDPRSTNDIDVVISLPLGQIGVLADALGADFEIDRDMLQDALLRASSANGFYLPVLTKIDFFGLGHEPFDEIEFARRRPVVVGPNGESLVIKSPEDSVLRKLLWYRQGAGVSDKQWRDIVSILRVSRDQIDSAYLLDWAQRLVCENLLARAQADAGS